MNKSHENPLSFRNIIAGIIVTVFGGIILAFIIQDARFSPKPTDAIPSSLPSLHRTPSTLSTTIPSLTQVSNGNTEIVIVNGYKTSAFFNGEIFITINEIEYLASHKYSVNLTIGAPGFSNQIVENAEIGFAAIFESNHKYDIRIGAINRCESFWSMDILYCVEFFITRLND